MSWVDLAVERLSKARAWSYHARGASASEPAALTALALLAADRAAAASAPLAWLARLQGADGSVGISAAQAAPGWPTGWAVLAWTAAGSADSALQSFSSHVDRAARWLLEERGLAIARTEPLGHDSTLVGWPWVDGTHSWVEPTAVSLLALRAAGFAAHTRAREAERLLVDRLLPGGGANYGNTFVLSQELRPHVLPTAMSMLAVAGRSNDPRVGRSLEYLERELTPRLTSISLSFAVLALSAGRALTARERSLLEKAYGRVIARDASPYKLAALVLAAHAAELPLAPRRLARASA